MGSIRFAGRMALAVGLLLAGAGARAASVVEDGLAAVGAVEVPVIDTLQDVIASGRIFWRHPKGDKIRKICEHRDPVHPDGDGGTVPCTHAPVQAHPGGDKKHVPCVDPSHATMKGPCPGHKRKVPCIHLKAPHKNHEVPRTPCVHLRARHPDGDPTGKVTSCIHDLEPVEVDRDLGLVFYECDATFRHKIKAWVRKLRGWGVVFAAPRPLHVFNRPLLRGPYADSYGDQASRDPFWSHYCTFEKKARHYLQVAREHGDAPAAHELGHAITGDKCVFILSGGGPHSVEGSAAPGLALSEGWADFVSMALLLEPGGSTVWPYFPKKGYDAERGTRVEEGQAPVAIGPSARKELSIAFFLWDLFDSPADGKDELDLKFSQLFKVFKPRLEALVAGPAIPDLGSYVDRLVTEVGSAKGPAIRAIRGMDAP